MNHIVVPLDGSEFAQRAVPVAVDLAKRSKASLSLVGVFEFPVAASPFGTELYPGVDGSELRGYLQGQAATLGSVGAGPVLSCYLVGPPVATLTDWIERNQPDLVVMTTHGRGPWSRFWLGSVADELIKRVTRPILLIRPDDQPSALGPWRRVLVPVDLSDGSLRVLETVAPLARLFDAEIELLHVVIRVKVVGPGFGIEVAGLPADYTKQLVAQANAKLGTIVDGLRAGGNRASYAVKEAESAVEAIIAEAEAAGFDAVAMATRAPRGVTRAILGSVADKVIRGADVPVLLSHIAAGS